MNSIPELILYISFPQDIMYFFCNIMHDLILNVLSRYESYSWKVSTEEYFDDENEECGKIVPAKFIQYRPSSLSSSLGWKGVFFKTFF